MIFEYLYLIELPTPTGDIGFGISMCEVRDKDVIQRRHGCCRLRTFTSTHDTNQPPYHGSLLPSWGAKPANSGILLGPNRQAMGGCPSPRNAPCDDAP